MHPIDADIADAKAAIETFLASATAKTRIERLRAEHPNHPVLWVMALAPFAAGISLVLAIGYGAAPFVSRDLAEAVALLDPAGVVPFLFLAQAGGAGVVYALMGVLAASRGSASPLLPDEARKHARLVGELWRLQAMARLNVAA